MFKEIFRFEVAYQIRQPLFYIATAIFFLLTFGAVTSDEVVIGESIGNVNRNAPFVIMQIMLVMSVIGVFTTTAFVANASHRDIEYDIQSIFFSTPLKKGDYLLGRFLGGLFIATMVFLGVVLAIALGGFMPWLEAERIGPFEWKPYIFSLLFLVLPNLFLTGSIFFSISALSRSTLSTYAGVILFFVAYGVSSTMLSDIQNDTLAGLIDPFGFSAFTVATKYWTVFEKNTSVLPIHGIFLYNRLLWIGIALLVWFFTYTRYRFTASLRAGRKKRQKIVEPDLPAIVSLERPVAAASYRKATSLKQYFHQTRVEILGIFKSVPFLIMLFLGVSNVIGGSSGMDEMFGTPVYPVTHLILNVIQGSFFLFMFLILTFYSGELVWKERVVNLSGVFDALPFRTWIAWASKITALAVIQQIMLLAAALTGIGIQLYFGYSNFDLPLYGKMLFLETNVQFLQIAVLTFFLQVIVNNKFTGFLLSALYFIAIQVLPNLDLEHNLYRYAGSPSAPYSDMNGYGHFVQPLFWFGFYWSFGAMLLLVLTHLFWVRGAETSRRWRLHIAGQRWNWNVPVRNFALVAIAGMLATGSFIYYNTNVLNEYITRKASEKRQADFEKRYKQYETMEFPRIIRVNAGVDIFPYERSVAIKGNYVLKNKSNSPLSELHLRLNPDVKIRSISLPATLQKADKDLGYYFYRMKSPLQPGQEIMIAFDLLVENHGFVNERSDTRVVYNGTFFNSDHYFPHIGYNGSDELVDRSKRKKYGLTPVQRMPKITDESARRNHYIASEADWIDFETTVSTTADQIAIAPGYLQKEWTANGRRYFHYKMDAPILPYWAYLSARYRVRKDSWNGVAIEVYYHKDHPYNLDRMIHAVKKSLSYFTTNFSPYQHRQVRIFEFPRYARFAQSFPNTIPFSESIGFIARLEDEEDLDYVFYVTAHEVAHQWWAHQVIGAYQQGSTVMSETLSQYSALMVMEQEYGKRQMRKFLKYELDRYLRGRGAELEAELPLILVEDQGYIHYSKGSLAMYALKEAIGEEKVNAALSRYISDVAYQEPPYTNSLEFLSYIRKETPAEKVQLLADLFQNITLYDLKAKDPSVERTSDGKYRIQFSAEMKKFRADAKGKENEVQIDDWLEVGVFGKAEKKWEENVLAFEKRHIQKAVESFQFVVDQPPGRVGIDPYNKMIDRNPEDNTVKVN